MKNKGAAAEVIVFSEHGAVEARVSPSTRGLYTAISFILFGSIPLISYFITPLIPLVWQNQFGVACVCTGIALFILGAFKTYMTQKSWIQSGIEMLFVGVTASSIAYAIGYLLSWLK